MRYRFLASVALSTGAILAQPLSSQNPVGILLPERFESASLGASKRYIIYLPPSYRRESTRRYPVMFLLHGLTGSEGNWSMQGRFAAIADSLAAADVPEMIVVMPDGDNSFWTDWAESPGRDACVADTTSAESADAFCVNRNHYGSYVARDLVQYIDAEYRTIPSRDHRGVAGLSMGGMGALTLAFTFPDVFSAALSLSAPATPLRPGIQAGDTNAVAARTLLEWETMRGRPLNAAWRSRWGSEPTSWWRQDPELGARRLTARPTPTPKVMLVIGVTDLYFAENRALHRAFDRIGLMHEYLERPGGHTWDFWRDNGPAGFAWLARLISGP